MPPPAREVNQGMTTRLKGRLFGADGRWLDRLLVWVALALVGAIGAFAIYYYLDRPGETGPGLVEQQTGRLEDTVRGDPNSFSARLALARTYETAERHADALQQYQMALQIAPESIEATLGLARVQLAMGDLAGAAASFQQVIDQREGAEFAPVDALLQEAHYFLGEIYVEQQQYEAAIEHLTAAAAIDSTDADSLYKLCEAYLGAGNNEQAIESCDRAVVMVPNFGEAYDLLAQAHKNAGQSLQAKYASAMALYSRNRRQDAVAELRAVVAEDPRFWDAYAGLGLALEEDGQREEAILAYQQALAGDPDNFLARLGVVRLGARPQSDAAGPEEATP